MGGKKSGIVKRKNERKNCPICDKVVANGKALGGHLRAHFAKHPLPAPNPVLVPQNRSQNVSDPAPARAPTLAAGTSGARILRTRNRRFSFSELTESESGSGSLKYVTRKRSKRVYARSKPPSALAAATSASPAPGIVDPEILAAKHGAECLMMLSRDSWLRNDLSFVGQASAESCKTCLKRSRKTTGRYPCVICCKVFGTGQALGGHMKVHVPRTRKGVNNKFASAIDLSDVSGLTNTESLDSQ